MGKKIAHGKHSAQLVIGAQASVGAIGAPKGVESATASGAFELVALSQTSSGHTTANLPGTNNTWTIDVSRVVPTANENRPRNVSMHYIIKF